MYMILPRGVIWCTIINNFHKIDFAFNVLPDNY